MSNWDEKEHPRNDDGRFKGKGGGLTPNESKRLKELGVTREVKAIQLPPQEYAELNSAIRTKFGNKIPKSGGTLYKDSYYVYNYNRRQEKMVCIFKIQIVGNEELINFMMEENDDTNN